MYVAALSLVTLVAGFVGLRDPGDTTPTAIRVDSAGLLLAPVAVTVPEPTSTTVAPGAISLHALASELQARHATSTTQRRATTTTKKPAVTTTTAKPVTTTTSPAPAPEAQAAPATTTPTTAPPTPLTTVVASAAPPPVAAATTTTTKTDTGIASWFGAPAATCAHLTIPMGTIVKVTRLHNGATTTCTVDDRGPTAETGRLIDLSLDTFEKLAPRGIGLIDVKIEW
jgi:rare lipoprotein A (peptidoglycan hydrolase)